MDIRQSMWKLIRQQGYNDDLMKESSHLLPPYESGEMKLAHVLSQNMTQTNFSNTHQVYSGTPTDGSSIWREILRFLPPVSRSGQRKSSKTHDFSRAIRGEDYVFEPIGESLRAYITGYGSGMKVGDYLILREGFDRCRYQVEEIDYYSNPEDMWIALVKQVGFLQS